MIVLQNELYIIAQIVYHTGVILQILCKPCQKKFIVVILRKITFFYVKSRNFTSIYSGNFT